MIKHRLPLLSLGIIALSSLLMLLPIAMQSSLHFNRASVTSGAFGSLLSGHFVHVDASHWLWNGVALLGLGAFIERRSRRLMLASLLLGLLAVNLLLLSPFSHIVFYCGLSGVLNSLLVVALWLFWRQTRSRWVFVSALLCLGKLGVELLTGSSLLTQNAWQAYPAAHLAGTVGGVVCAVGAHYWHCLRRVLGKLTFCTVRTRCAATVVTPSQ